MDWDARRLGRHLKLRDLNVLMTVARCGTMGKHAYPHSSAAMVCDLTTDTEVADGTRQG